jgi:hypothetical protein
MQIKNCSETGIDPLRKVLYRNLHEIDGVVYLVEISRNHLKVFILLFPNFEKPGIFIHEILYEKMAQKLMSDSENIFEKFILRFKVRYNKLLIDGVHGK